jgi:hypothetical protein
LVQQRDPLADHPGLLQILNAAPAGGFGDADLLGNLAN